MTSVKENNDRSATTTTCALSDARTHKQAERCGEGGINREAQSDPRKTRHQAKVRMLCDASVVF